MKWIDHYQEFRSRYRFLMMWGHNKTGKTEFIKYLFPTALQVNCTGSLTTPDLRRFDTVRHEAIFFDEVSLEMVLKNKKLFCAMNSLVEMSQSKGDQYTYNLYLYRKKMIICNNNFEEKLSELTSANRNWILDHCVPLQIRSGDLYVE